MSFLQGLLGGKAANNVAPAATGVPIQTSCYGRAVPLVYGTTRCAGNILEMENFKAVQVSNGGGNGGGGSGGNGCFVGDSRVDTPYGPLKLSGLREGDPIWCQDPDGKVVFGSVMQVLKHNTAETHDRMVKVYFARGARGWLAQFLPESVRRKMYRESDSIYCTDLHSLWDCERTDHMRAAKDFKPGDALTHRLWENVWVLGVEEAPAEEHDYNLVVHPNHNFFVNGILAHNGGNNSGKGGSTYNYFTDVAVGICEGPIVGYYAEWIGSGLTNTGSDGWTQFVGTYPQSVWKTEAYAGLAYLSRLQYPLGTSASLPQWNFEVLGMFEDSAPGTYGGNGCAIGGDADPTLVVSHFLTDPTVGAGFPASRLGELVTESEAWPIPGGPSPTVTVDFTAVYSYNLCVVDSLGNLFTCVAANPGPGQYAFSNAGAYNFNSADSGKVAIIRYVYNNGLPTFKAWALAAGLWISPCYDTQTQASSMVDDICTGCYVSAVWSSGALKFIPRSATSVSGHGYTYNAPTAPLFSLDDTDFLKNTNVTGAANSGTNDDPLIVTRSRSSDQINDIKIEFLDRANQYAPSIAEYSDDANFDSFGKRARASQTLHMFCDAGAANTSARLQMQDQYIRNTYSFTLDARWVVLDPMDIVEVSDSFQGISNQWVRITEITENNDGTLSVAAEEYPTGSGAPATYSFGTGSGFYNNLMQSAGSVNTPVLVAMPIALADNAGLAVGIGVSSTNPVFGGCQVWISTDGGQTYTRHLPDIRLSARIGTLVGDFPVGMDPDETNSIVVDFTGSPNSEFTPSPKAAADQDFTLCLVRGTNGDEYVSTSNVELSGSMQYTFNEYIRRGQQSTKVVDHPVGSVFMSMDQAVYQVAFAASQINSNIMLKFPTFNVWDGGLQTLDDCTAYSFGVPQPPTPPDVQNFGASQNGAVVSFAWDAVDYPLISLAGYLIGYAPEGTTNWSAFTLLTETAAGTEMTNGEVPPGTWAFGIRAASTAYKPGSGSTIGLSPDITIVNLVVTNSLPVVYDQDSAPLWEAKNYYDFGNVEDAPVITADFGSVTSVVTTVIDYGSLTT